MKVQGIHAAFIHCEPGHHQAFNRWHDYDHRPENAALRHIFHSQRWVAPPDYIAARERVDGTYFAYGGGEYFVSYWTEGPVDEMERDFNSCLDQLKLLGRFDYEYKSLGWGRDQKRYGRDRDFNFIKAWTRRDLPVSAAAVPLVPHRGVYVVLSEVIDPVKADEWYRWYDTIRAPDIMECKGFMAAFRFARYVQMPKPVILDLYYLDADPLVAAADLRKQTASGGAQGRGFPEELARNVLISSPYRPIIPDQYGFYD